MAGGVPFEGFRTSAEIPRGESSARLGRNFFALFRSPGVFMLLTENLFLKPALGVVGIYAGTQVALTSKYGENGCCGIDFFR